MVSNAGLITAPHFDLLEATKWKNHKSNKSLNRETMTREERKQARQEKNWAESDRLRDLIKEKGYEVKDTKDGMVLNAQ